MSSALERNKLTKVDDTKVIQDSSGYKRICYGSESGDLFLWIDEKDQTLSSFQLSFYTFGDDRTEQIIYWNGKKLKTGLVDSKEVDGRAHDMQAPTVQFYVNSEKNVIEKGANFIRDNGSNLPKELNQSILKVLRAK